MNIKCDFYIMDHDKSMEWIGSSSKGGDPIDIPLKIIIQNNKQMFTEYVVDYLEEKEGFINNNGISSWPWMWEDSCMTPYSYIFDVCKEKVYVCEFGGNLLDPIRIFQGYDVIGADVGRGRVKFPKMIKKEIIKANEMEDLLKEYGFQSTKIV